MLNQNEKQAKVSRGHGTSKNRHIELNHEACYSALKARDARFDGRFFVGVSSTGIYCRPICRARLPKPENCTFYKTASAAERAGYRPCLKCRPELAPGNSIMDAGGRLARRAAMALESGDLNGESLRELATKLGVTERHLRRVFSAAYGVPPVQYLQTVRLLLAKTLLTDTGLTLTDIAMASGFGSLRRFNELFKKHYHLPPSQLRGEKPKLGMTLLMGYRPPYDWDFMLNFLSTRAIPGVESVTSEGYRRTVALMKGGNRYCGWIEVSNKSENNALAVTLAPNLLPVLPQVLMRIRRLFDLDCDPHVIDKGLEDLERALPGVNRLGIRLPGCFEPFEMAVRAVLGQQVTVKAARTLAMRMVNAYGEAIKTPFEDLNVMFPSAEVIRNLEGSVADHLGPLGITGARSRCIKGLADAMAGGEVDFSFEADPELEMKKLLKLPGFGPWTVAYMGMRAFSWPDAFPHTDYGVKMALEGKSPKEILAMSEAWRPWRSYATMLLWRSLSVPKEVTK